MVVVVRRAFALLAALSAVVMVAGPAVAEPFPARRVVTRVAWTLPSPRLDQGARDTCEVYAIFQAINMQPGPKIGQELADRMSDEIQAQPVSAARNSEDVTREVLARHGYPTRYRHLTGGPDEALSAVRAGPVVVAVPFWTAMIGTGKDGRWKASGSFMHLGHGLVLYGGDYTKGRALLLNQWGRGWGVDGTTWMTIPEFRAIAANPPGYFTATVWTRDARP